MRAKTLRTLGLGTWAALALSVGCIRVCGAWQGFLSLEGYTGEATERDHVGWLTVRAFDDAMLSDLSYRKGGGLNGGQVTLQPLKITRTVDRASPALFGALATRSSIRSGVLDLITTGGTAAPGKTVSFLKLQLNNILVTAISNTAGVNGEVLETLQLRPRDLTFNSVKLTVTAKAAAATLASRVGAVVPSRTAAGDIPLAGSDSAWQAATGLISRNRLRNPGAEEALESDPLLAPVAPAGWDPTDGISVLRYGDVANASGLHPGQGLHLFAAGSETGWGKAVQTVDVSAEAIEVDQRRLKAILSGWLGSGDGTWDAAQLTARFRDVAGEILGAVQVVDDEEAVQADGTISLKPYTQTADLPAGTRSIEVTLALERYAEGMGMGLADELSLTIEQTQTPSTAGGMEIRVVRFSHPSGSPIVRLSWPDVSGTVLLESAPQVDGPWSVEASGTEFQEGDAAVELPIDRAVPGRFWRLRKAQVGP